jgi:hypothetical protein
MKSIWMDAVVANAEVLSRHIFGGVEENYERRQTGQQVPRLRFEPRIFRIQVLIITAIKTCSVPLKMFFTCMMVLL